MTDAVPRRAADSAAQDDERVSDADRARGVDGSYELSDDPARLDLDAVWAFLSEDAYWGRWRTRADLDAQVERAWRVVGAYAPGGAQVGFARAVSDGAGFAYLADVYVHPDHRGHRLGHRLVRTMVDDGPGADFRWVLFTRDAHGLYASHGFSEPGSSVMVRPAGGPFV